ncbi:hypothetical protein Pcinc_003662 [Petrolisthes cinctipes]|uniref:Endonuclease/exonuclease/phosphatase domain-containing protein n=1 Tax=Petrolisthes cinctipes TaxID=88211 RepID=A0AAE1GIS7_PETCI|nr:hypothetical protein Pcinc_003662 [Petrolisthes cinctipes]
MAPRAVDTKHARPKLGINSPYNQNMTNFCGQGAVTHSQKHPSTSTTTYREILQVDTGHLNITSVYKQPATPFTWKHTCHNADKASLYIGDFNSHSTTWGYNETNTDGEAVEAFAAVKDLRLLYDAKDPTSFQSARWRRGYNPDLAFISSKHYRYIEKSMGNPIPKTQHQTILIDVRPVIRPQKPQQRPRFNFRKANWEGFMSDIEQVIHSINPTPEEYDNFPTLVWKAARNNILRGCMKTYIPGLAEPN